MKNTDVTVSLTPACHAKLLADSLAKRLPIDKHIARVLDDISVDPSPEIIGGNCAVVRSKPFTKLFVPYDKDFIDQAHAFGARFDKSQGCWTVPSVWTERAILLIKETFR
jgi:hypothetical protein